MGCVVVPLPLRRRVPGCCRSKLFAPSVAFALAVGARLPLVPAFAGLLTTRPQDSSSYGPTTCSSPKATLSWRFDARVSPPAGHQLRGKLRFFHSSAHRPVSEALDQLHRKGTSEGRTGDVVERLSGQPGETRCAGRQDEDPRCSGAECSGGNGEERTRRSDERRERPPPIAGVTASRRMAPVADCLARSTMREQKDGDDEPCANHERRQQEPRVGEPSRVTQGARSDRCDDGRCENGDHDGRVHPLFGRLVLVAEPLRRRHEGREHRDDGDPEIGAAAQNQRLGSSARRCRGPRYHRLVIAGLLSKSTGGRPRLDYVNHAGNSRRRACPPRLPWLLWTRTKRRSARRSKRPRRSTTLDGKRERARRSGRAPFRTNSLDMSRRVNASERRPSARTGSGCTVPRSCSSWRSTRCWPLSVESDASPAMRNSPRRARALMPHAQAPRRSGTSLCTRIRMPSAKDGGRRGMEGLRLVSSSWRPSSTGLTVAARSWTSEVSS